MRAMHVSRLFQGRLWRSTHRGSSKSSKSPVYIVGKFPSLSCCSCSQPKVDSSTLTARLTNIFVLHISLAWVSTVTTGGGLVLGSIDILDSSRSSKLMGRARHTTSGELLFLSCVSLAVLLWAGRVVFNPSFFFSGQYGAVWPSLPHLKHIMLA